MNTSFLKIAHVLISSYRNVYIFKWKLLDYWICLSFPSVQYIYTATLFSLLFHVSNTKRRYPWYSTKKQTNKQNKQKITNKPTHLSDSSAMHWVGVDPISQEHITYYVWNFHSAFYTKTYKNIYMTLTMLIMRLLINNCSCKYPELEDLLKKKKK